MEEAAFVAQEQEAARQNAEAAAKRKGRPGSSKPDQTALKGRDLRGLSGPDLEAELLNSLDGLVSFSKAGKDDLI